MSETMKEIRDWTCIISCSVIMFGCMIAHTLNMNKKRKQEYQHTVANQELAKQLLKQSPGVARN